MRCASCRARSPWSLWSTASRHPALTSPRSPSEHIVAQETSLVGSIGVLFQYPNFTDVLKTIGIKVEEVKSSPLKAAPNGFEPTSPEARAAIESIVLDSYSWFKGLVKDRRKMDDSLLTQVADGRVFTGRQAINLKLVDDLGNEKTALAWLEKEKKVPADTPVRDYSLQPRFSELSFLHLAAWTFEAIGFERHCAPHRGMGRSAGN